eukprot:1161188-Pelagomonas_calceolata.AAC.2
MYIFTASLHSSAYAHFEADIQYQILLLPDQIQFTFSNNLKKCAVRLASSLHSLLVRSIAQ